MNREFSSFFANFTDMARLILLLLFPIVLSAQDTLGYGQHFRLRDGIYLDYQQFRQNKPVPRSSIISSNDSTRLDYIRLATNARTLIYRDSSGKTVEINPAKLWGFCENNSVYIRYNNDFNKIVVMGSICHFTAMQTTYMTTGPTYPAGSVYGTPVKSMQQYILDTKTGAVLDYTLANIESILSRDAELHAEFMKLRKTKRKKMMFYYLRKYNERNPLVF